MSNRELPELPESFRQILEEKLAHTHYCGKCYNDYLHDMGADWLPFSGDCERYKLLEQKLRDWQPEPGEIWPPTNTQ